MVAPMLPLLVSAVLLAGQTPAAEAPSTAPERPSVIVMAISAGSDVDADVGRTLSGLLTAAMAREQRLRFISGDELSQLMALEGEKARLGCDEDESCLADIAGALGARFAVGGRLSRLGELLVLQVRLLDVHKAESLSRVVRNASDVEAFVTQMNDIAHELLGPALERVAQERGPEQGEVLDDNTAAPPPPPDVNTAVESPPTSSSAEEGMANEDREGSLLLPAALIGGGAVLIGAAAVASLAVTGLDLALISFVGPQLGPEDAIAPAVYVLSAAVAAGGVVLCLLPLFLGDEEES